MSKRTAPKLTAPLNKPKRTFKTIQVRPEVLELLAAVEDEYAEKNRGIRPSHSTVFINALTDYRETI